MLEGKSKLLELSSELRVHAGVHAHVTQINNCKDKLFINSTLLSFILLANIR